MRVRTFAVIPVRGLWPYTSLLLDDLERQRVDDVLILDNASPDDTAKRVRSLQAHEWRHRLHITAQPGATIYELWNHGFARAKRLAAGRWFNVLVLNNDVRLPRVAVKALAGALEDTPEAWVVYPDYDAPWMADPFDYERRRVTRGVYGDGGMFGPCFMLAGHRIPWRPLVTDTTYEWWWGDNHLAECIEQEGGQQVRVVGLPVKHAEEATARLYPELERAKLRDKGRWITREARGARAVDRRSA